MACLVRSRAGAGFGLAVVGDALALLEGLLELVEGAVGVDLEPLVVAGLGQEDVEAVLALFGGAVGEGGAAVAVPAVVHPLALVAEAVGALAAAEAFAPVLDPFPGVGLDRVGFDLLVVDWAVHLA